MYLCGVTDSYLADYIYCELDSWPSNRVSEMVMTYSSPSS
jgi:hypothetical protein